MNDLDLCLEVVQGHVNHRGVNSSKTACAKDFQFGTRLCIGNFLLVVLWNQAYISNGFRDDECDAMVDVTLIRPLNKGQGHSFWYQSISHIGLPIGCQ